MDDTKPVNTTNAPIASSLLTDITSDACRRTFDAVTGYEHAQTSSWNTGIINSILQQLISKTSESGKEPQYKFAVTSTIFQHNPPSLKEEPGSQSKGDIQEAGTVGKRGMHSATGAYWNNEKDGMWSHKHEEEKKGFDVVVSIIWISIS